MSAQTQTKRKRRSPKDGPELKGASRQARGQATLILEVLWPG